jgi:Domain of unknown function (DUF5916)/Carbohydrate family 9 binding domain-like
VQTAEATNPIDYTTAHLERVVHALRTDEPITVDGKLTEEAWQRAEPANHFVQWNPHPGVAASDDTDVRILYDDHNLYIGARCWDSDIAHVTVNGLERDFASGNQDGFGIFFDSLHDGQSGFYFATNPVGAHHDFQSSGDDTARNVDWEGVWDVKVTIDDSGWTAEFVIPFKTLRFSSAANQEWGLNMMRRIRRVNEDSHWAPLPRRYRVARASLAGTLTGLDDIHQGRNLKIKPYAISKTVAVGAAPHSQEGDGGLDVKYGLTESMTVDLGYRTDFSQVEVDQQQINLTRFNLFFPEKREFFLENSGIFGVASAAGPAGSTNDNVIPFFSRRIGLSANGSPIPIVGGARLSGKAGPYEIGVLDMKTRQEDDNPSNNFLVGRVRRTFRSQSTAGAFVTLRDGSSPDDNRLYGVDTFLRFFEKLEVSSYLMRTSTPSRTGKDQSRHLGVTWRDDDWSVVGDYEDVQPDFNPEVGFVRRSDMNHYSTDLSWRPRPRSHWIRNYILGTSADYYTASSTGAVETRQQSLNTGLSFQSGASLTGTVANTFDRLVEPFTIRPGVLIPIGDYQYASATVNYSSDPSRQIGGSASVAAGEFWDGRSTSVSGALNFKPDYHVNLALTLSRSDVRLPEGDFTTSLVGAKVLYGFSSKMFLSSFVQYNAATSQFSANTRFNIIHHPLSDLFVVYNERRETRSGNLLERGVIVKFTNMFDF